MRNTRVVISGDFARFEWNVGRMQAEKFFFLE